jgi:DNA topoisomerase I
MARRSQHDVNPLPVRSVAEYLGNTAAVARTSYVDPLLIDLYDDGATVCRRWNAPRVRPTTKARTVERAVLRLLSYVLPPTLTTPDQVWINRGGVRGPCP